MPEPLDRSERTAAPRRASFAPALLAGAALVVVALVYWQTRVIAPIQTHRPIDRLTQDLYTIYLPVHRYAFQSAELLPLWNPYQLAGMPSLAAYNGGWLYPLNVLSLLLPLPLALGMICALSLAIAGLTTRACARALGLSEPASLLAALLFMLGSHLVLQHLQPSFLAGTSLVPLVFLLAGRMVMRPSLRHGAWLGAALALQLLTGHAQIVLYTLYGVCVAALPVLVARLGRSGTAIYLGRLALAAAIAGIFGLALAAVQLLPTLELARAAVRGRLTLQQIWASAPPPFTLRGAATTLGPGALLALAAALDRKRRLAVASAALVVAFAWAFGLGTPLFDLLHRYAPGIDRFRLPSRMLLIGDLGMALLAAIGFDALRERSAQSLQHAPRATRVSGDGAADGAAVRAAQPTPSTGAALLAIGAVAWLVVALLGLERFRAPANVLPVPQRSGEAVLTAPRFVRFLRERIGNDRAILIKSWSKGKRFPLTEKLGSLHEIPVVQDFEPLAPRIYLDFLAGLGRRNVDHPLFWGRYQPAARSEVWTALNMLAVRYVVVEAVSAWDAKLPPRFRRIYADGQVRIYENTHALPRAWLAPEHESIANPRATLRRIRAIGFDPRRTALVDRAVEWPDGPPPRADLAGTAPQGGRASELGTVEWVASTPEEIVLHVSAAARSILVLADLDWPGWSVTVDGAPRELLRTDFLLRGVAVPAGTHEVRFRYAPASVRIGLAITVAALLALVALALRDRSRDEGRRSAAAATARATAALTESS